MKVYSWKTLLITIFIGGAGLVYSMVRLYNEDLWGVAWMLLFGIEIFKGIQASITEKGYQKNVENEQKGKRVYKTLFGKLAPIMPYGGVICFVIAAILVRVFPMRIWIGMCFIIAAPIYQIWLTIVVRKELGKEEIER